MRVSAAACGSGADKNLPLLTSPWRKSPCACTSLHPQAFRPGGFLPTPKKCPFCRTAEFVTHFQTYPGPPPRAPDQLQGLRLSFTDYRVQLGAQRPPMYSADIASRVHLSVKPPNSLLAIAARFSSAGSGGESGVPSSAERRWRRRRRASRGRACSDDPREQAHARERWGQSMRCEACEAGVGVKAPAAPCGRSRGRWRTRGRARSRRRSRRAVVPPPAATVTCQRGGL